MGYVTDTQQQIEEAGTTERAVIETLQQIVFAFVLAFVFRSFVVEAFVIPTGSMAPTLLGAHLVARGPDTGYTFAIGPRESNANSLAERMQGGRGGFSVPDPMIHDQRYDLSRSGPREIEFQQRRIRMGDRILVLKYLYCLFEPKRFDVVVFKNPGNRKDNPYASQNFIKRLIGLPGETVWLADGDVFISTTGAAGPFNIQRKPEHLQRRIWLPVYHSQYVLPRSDDVIPHWSPPWSGDGWVFVDPETSAPLRSYRLETAQRSTLRYRHDIKPIVDEYPYNSSSKSRSFFSRYPVSDIRLAAGIEPDEDGLTTSIRLECRDHVFEARIGNGMVSLHQWATDESVSTELTSSTLKGAFRPGRVTNIEFWHVDQALWLWIDGKKVAYATYFDDWDANERLEFATGLSGDRARARGDRSNPYVQPGFVPKEPRLTWTFQGSPLTLHRLELDRDLYYQPGEYRSGELRGRPALATHPLNLPSLNSDQFFVCGDNSPASHDARYWGAPVPWVAQQMDDTAGVVARDLMLGKAFFVYFPSPEGLGENATRFIPNFGEMRFIH